MLQIIADPSHEDHDMQREWLGFENGDTWDLHAFDLDAINQAFASEA